MKLIKETIKWKNYQTNNFQILYRNKNSISWDNSINPEELIYFITIKSKQ